MRRFNVDSWAHACQTWLPRVFAAGSSGLLRRPGLFFVPARRARKDRKGEPERKPTDPFGAPPVKSTPPPSAAVRAPTGVRAPPASAPARLGGRPPPQGIPLRMAVFLLEIAENSTESLDKSYASRWSCGP